MGFTQLRERVSEGILMARIATEVRVEEREWTLVFKSAGWQKKLHWKGFSKVRRLNAEEEDKGGRDVVNLGSYLDAKSPPCSKSKTDVGRNNSCIVNGRSTDPRGPAAALRGQRGNKGVSNEWSLSNVRDVVIVRKLEDCRGGAGASLSYPSAETNKRRKFVPAPQSFLFGDRSHDQLLPVLSTKVIRGQQLLPTVTTKVVRGLLPAAGPLADAAPAPMDEGSESSLDGPIIRDEVDNFIILSNDNMVSVTMLPVCIDGVLTGGAIPPEKVVVVGTVGPDCVTFKERVEMWRLMLDPSHRPWFLLKTKKGAWVGLRNPKDVYSKIMNDLLVLGHFLNFVKKFPNESPTAAEEDLRKMCRMHSNKPSLDTLSRHIKVIRSFIEEDDEFASAPLLRKIFPNLFPNKPSLQTDELYHSGSERDTAGIERQDRRLPLKSEGTKKKEKRYKVMAKKYSQKPKLFKVSTPELHCHSDHKLKAGRNPQDVEHRPSEGLQWDEVAGTEDQPEDDLRSKDVHRRIFTQAELDVEDPPICILCDDGGSLLYCDGPCHRHFHPTKESGAGSFCKTLGLSKAEVKAMGKYYCPNCKYKQQQCFICGELGSSVATAYGPQQVRCCDVPFCYRYFHVECAVEALCASSDEDWTDLQDAINDGREKLYCPRHCCSVCGEAQMEEPGMLVQCRRCPKGWHRECLVDYSRSKELESTLIWDHYDREFIYCRDHEIIPETETPARTHVKFPNAW